MTSRLFISILILPLLLVAPVAANKSPGYQIIIDNLQYKLSDYQTEPPIFRCGDMAVMSYEFFTLAEKDCCVKVGYKPNSIHGHAWIEFDDAPHQVYEPIYKWLRDKGFHDNNFPLNQHELSAEQYQLYHKYWINWYDWKYMRGDLNEDNIINIYDFVLFARAYGTNITEEKYAMLGDMELDGDVDISDFVLFAGVYGTEREVKDGRKTA